MPDKPVVRAEYVREQVKEQNFGVVRKPLTVWERVWGQSAVRKAVILIVLAGMWQAYASYLNNTLLVPTFLSTVQSFLAHTLTGELPAKAWVSIKVLLQGYAIGLALALVIAVLAVTSQIGNDLLEALTAMVEAGAIVSIVDQVLPLAARPRLLKSAQTWGCLGEPLKSKCSSKCAMPVSP